MRILFVTGSNDGFFNSLPICLQSFAERLPGQSLLVCDFGFAPAQAQFLHGLGILLPCPPELAGRGVFFRKASLIRYLHHNGLRVEDFDAVVWLDADLTLMDVGLTDFERVVAAMQSANAAVAACAEPGGRSIGGMINMFGDPARMAPFARLVDDAGFSRALPYYSTGIVFVRSTALLERWMETTLAVADHPLVEQNSFNVALHKHAVPHLTLDCEEWQAQGFSLDRVRLVEITPGQRPVARINEKNIKTLHTTSPLEKHLVIANARMTVRDLALTGPFKLFRPEALRLHQLQILASFILGHGEQMRQLGICTHTNMPVEGYEFVTL